MNLSIASIGSSAQCMLGASASVKPAAGTTSGLKGSVVAEFSRCCYVCFPDKIKSANSSADNYLCIGHPDILPGPINLLFAGDADWNNFKYQITKEAVLSIGEKSLVLGLATCEFSDARISNDSVRHISSDLDVSCIQVHMLCLSDLAPAHSLASILYKRQSEQSITKHTALQSSFIDFMLPACATLGHSLQALLNSSNSSKNYLARTTLTDDAANAAIAVLGAGGGLTPAGDDLLAGIFLGLHYYGFVEQSQQIMNMLAPSLPSATNVISSALLQQAAAGKAGQAMLDVFRSLNTSAAIDLAPVARLLDQQGHTSGWDCFAGLTLLTQAVTQQSPIELFNNTAEYQC